MEAAITPLMDSPTTLISRANRSNSFAFASPDFVSTFAMTTTTTTTYSIHRIEDSAHHTQPHSTPHSPTGARPQASTLMTENITNFNTVDPFAETDDTQPKNYIRTRLRPVCVTQLTTHRHPDPTAQWTKDPDHRPRPADRV